jgi:EAL domain-containing protein (putative c-di-GMP-specific phosphodiesterase class I)/CHASE2 domain-containing sensor protein
MGAFKVIWSRIRGKNVKGSYSRARIFWWAVAISLVCGIIKMGAPLEDSLRTGRNWLRQHPASGNIVVVGIDNKSLKKLEKWPWPRHYHGELAEKLGQLGARRIFFDLDFSSRTDPNEDRALARAFQRLNGKVTLAALVAVDPLTNERTEITPLPLFGKHVHLANISLRYGRQSVVWDVPYAWRFGGGTQHTFSAALAAVSGGEAETYPLDYSIDLKSIPHVSAVDVLDDKVSASAIAGRDVVIGATSHQLGDTFFAPGYGFTSGVFLHVLGAETLKSGHPRHLSWFPIYLCALLIAAAACLVMKRAAWSVAVLSGSALSLLLLPLYLESLLIFIDIVPALLLMIIIAGRLALLEFKQSHRLRETTNALSGLPNLNALHQAEIDPYRPLVAGRVQNFPEITSALPAEQEKSLVEQIANRLALGRQNSKLFQGDEGIFVWVAEATVSPELGDQLEALHALFRSPLVVAGQQLDLTMTFGVETGSDRSIANRLGSALVAADEAAAEGAKWKVYDPAKLKDVAWKLSMLSQMDAAIDGGDLWVAYQPKLDLVTRRIIGAEALARWTHPEKGPISPIEFISAAEQHDRIEKLTRHVLERAIAAGAAINARGIPFGVSVNLSAKLIDDRSLAAMVAALLRKYRFEADQLTLEVTETAAINTSNTTLEALLELRCMGVQISIDDYGTGLSTLDYLKRIPATEIKIDRSFVQAFENSRSDRLLVSSTIQLAHSLGQKVVAEGVEEAETLEALARMGCDVAQGYLIGRPMTFRAITRQLFKERKQQAA